MKEVRRPNRLCGGLFFFLLSVAVSFGGDVAASPPDDVRVRMSVSPDTLLIGDPLTLHLEITHGRGEDVRVEGVIPASAAVERLSEGTEKSSARGDIAVDSLTFIFTTYETGDIVLGPVDVLLVRNGTPDTVRVEVPDVHVKSLLGPDAKDLRDIKGLLHATGRSRLAWIAAGVILFLLALVLFLLRRRRRSRAVRREAAALPLPPPDEWARHELAKIEAMELLARGKVKEHYVLVSDVLRHYISMRHGIEALERTTAEILGDLGAREAASDVRAEYAQILQDADLVKFAKWKPDAQASGDFIPRVRGIVGRTSPVEERVQEREVAHALR
jgi:cbb3-type cytochrome oxidase subunit 3